MAEPAHDFADDAPVDGPLGVGGAGDLNQQSQGTSFFLGTC